MHQRADIFAYLRQIEYTICVNSLLVLVYTASPSVIRGTHDVSLIRRLENCEMRRR